jgi:hypothetical protein
VERFGWAIALATGSAFGVVSALLWLFIRVDQIDRSSGEAAIEGGT